MVRSAQLSHQDKFVFKGHSLLFYRMNDWLLNVYLCLEIFIWLFSNVGGKKTVFWIGFVHRDTTENFLLFSFSLLWNCGFVFLYYFLCSNRMIIYCFTSTTITGEHALKKLIPNRFVSSNTINQWTLHPRTHAWHSFVHNNLDLFNYRLHHIISYHVVIECINYTFEMQ